MRARELNLSIVGLLLAAGVHAAGVNVEIDGLNEEQRDAVRATLELNDYQKREVTAAELRAAYKQADEQIRQALEPFGYYDSHIEKSLTGDANTGWKAKFTIQPGNPAVVRSARVEERMGSKHFILMYFASGIAGALFSFVLAPTASIIGASGGVFGVMMCFASFWPRQVIHIWGVIPIEAWLLVGLTTLFALFSGLTGTSTGTAHYAHLGGYIGAYLYLLVLERNSASRKFRAKVDKVAPTTEKVIKQNWKNVNLDGVHQLSRDEVNRILDKINAEGIGSLTTEEKLFLSNFVPPDDRKSWVQ